jgi:hypothetical protein
MSTTGSAESFSRMRIASASSRDAAQHLAQDDVAEE